MDISKQNAKRADSSGEQAFTPKSQAQVHWLNGTGDISTYSGCSRRTVSRWIANGELPVKRLSARHLLARPSDVDELINRLDREYRESQQVEADWLEEWE